MNNPTITHYLKQDSKTLGALLSKLNQLKRWNNWLAECLIEEGSLVNHCQIVNLIGNSLIAIADTPHWLTRIRFHIPELLPKLRKYPGLEKIQAICCKIQPNYMHQKSKKTRQPQTILTPKTASLVREMANKMSDEKLRGIFERIAARSTANCIG